MAANKKNPLQRFFSEQIIFVQLLRESVLFAVKSLRINKPQDYKSCRAGNVILHVGD